MANLVDACIFVAASAGTGSFVVSAPKPGWRSPANAGAVNGGSYRYRAFSADQTQWEIGTGVYTSGTTTLTRAVISDSSNAGAAVNFSAAPSVALTIFAGDIADDSQRAKIDFLTVTGAINLDTVKTKTGYLTVTASTDLDATRTKLALITVTSSTDLDTIRTKAGHITVTQAVDLDAIETNSNASKTKTDFLTVTQAVDLDAIETRVNALDTAVVLMGGWDASAGTFPGGGTAQAGASYIITVAGTVNSIAFSINDRVLAIADNASTTVYAANWLKLDYTDQVLSVDGTIGAVTVGAIIAAATGKTTPVDADSLALSDSAASNASKKVTWANIKITLDSYFKGLGWLSLVAGDTLYASGVNTLQRLAKGTDGHVLTLAAGVPSWAVPSAGGRTLLATLTTTSGTTQNVTSIPAGYTSLYIELESVSFTTNTAMKLALSSTNGAAYGSAVTVASAAAGSPRFGSIYVDNISSTVASTKAMRSTIYDGSSDVSATGILATNTAAEVDAIRFSGGTFNGGVIRVYGVK